MAGNGVYLNASGAAPLTDRTQEALNSGFIEAWADPAGRGRRSRHSALIRQAALQSIQSELALSAAELLPVPSLGLAIHQVIGGIFRARAPRKKIVISAIERDLVTATANYLSSDVIEIPVSASGEVELTDLEAALDDQVALVAIQHANQEIGTIQPVAEIATLTRALQIPLVVDASASVGHVPAPTDWDALIMHPADWGGPSGTSLVAMGPRTRWLPDGPEGDYWHGDGVPTPLLLASAVALTERLAQIEAHTRHYHELMEQLRTGLSRIKGVDLVGPAEPAGRLPHVLTASALYLDGESLLDQLDQAGFEVGSGSACVSTSLAPSRVLAAVGALTHGNIRIGLHPDVTNTDIDSFIATLIRVVADIRAKYGVEL